MKCPYCNKTTYDMPIHLRRNAACHQKHITGLRTQLKESMCQQLAKDFGIEPDKVKEIL